jgi:hypothetical protein
MEEAVAQNALASASVLKYWVCCWHCEESPQHGGNEMQLEMQLASDWKAWTLPQLLYSFGV